MRNNMSVICSSIIGCSAINATCHSYNLAVGAATVEDEQLENDTDVYASGFFLAVFEIFGTSSHY